MGLSKDEARSSIRISFSKKNTADEAVRAAQILAGCISALRAREEKE
jgi:cysteine sulfinate desulfinase/cysteine desulfurase-like protein